MTMNNLNSSFVQTCLLAFLPWMTLGWGLKLLRDITNFWLPTFVLFVVLALAYQCHIYPSYTSPLRAIPTPSGRSFWFGNRPSAGHSVKYDLARVHEKCPGKQLIRYYTYLNFEVVFAAGPDVLQELCFRRSSDFAHAGLVGVFMEAALGGVGLFGVSGNRHKRLRRLFSKVYNPGAITSAYPKIWEVCKEQVDCLNSNTDQPVDVIGWANHAILDLAGMGALGQSRGWLAQYPTLIEALTRRVSTANFDDLCLALLYRFIRPFLVLKHVGLQGLEDLNYLQYVSRDLLNVEKKRLSQKGATDSTNLISAMLESKDLNDDEMLGHIVTFLAAGFDSTATTFQWILVCLCKYPNTQARLRRELRDAFSTSKTSSTDKPFPSHNKLPYLQAVIDEVLRLHPAVILTDHQACRDTTLGDVFIPKGTLVLVSPMSIHMNAEIWGFNADIFEPDRWLGEGSARQVLSRCSSANMTFSRGPRDCPGQPVARMMLKCLTAALVDRYDMRFENPEQSVGPTDTITAKPHPRFKVRLSETL